MKKNMVIITPLFLFPLIACLSLSSMEERSKKVAPYTHYSTEQAFLDQVRKELEGLKLFQKQKELNATGDYPQPQTAINLVETINLMESTHETIMVEHPQYKAYVENNPLLQSVILPTEEKPLSWGEYFSYKISTSSGHLQKIIDRLKDDQFDTTDLTHIKWLNEAIATANQNEDIEALLTIADLCETKYKDKIRISPEIAQPASALINKYYTKELSTANEVLLKERHKEMQAWNIATAAGIKAIHEQINIYNQKMQAISNNYDASEKQQLERISDLQRKMKTFSILNREIRQGTNDLIEKNQVKTPTHIFATTMKQIEKKLNSIQKTLEEIPTIKTAQDNSKYLENILTK